MQGRNAFSFLTTNNFVALFINDTNNKFVIWLIFLLFVNNIHFEFKTKTSNFLIQCSTFIYYTSI